MTYLSENSTNLSAVLDRANAQDEKARDETFLNHPKGLFALFNLEVWERFSFLGFNAILALYLSDAVSNGGLGYNENIASSVVATYGALVYLLAVGGAWIADRASGARLALLWGAIIIACGHIFMSIPAEYATWVGLTLIIAGTGFLKPNVSSMVGDLYLYKNREQRRDAGFAIYYAGINLGAFLGPLIAGGLGQDVQWHAGFAAAAVGMTLGLILFTWNSKYLASRMRDIRVQKNFKMDSSFVMTIVIVIAAVGIGLAFATLSSDFLATIINGVTVISAIIPAAYLLWMYNSSKTTPTERLNMLPFGLLMVAEAAYYITYFQTGNTLNFVALNHTNNVFLGLKYPSTWYISLIALVEISMGPVLAALWVKMGDRQPSVPIKVGLGPVLGGCGFVIIAIASTGTLSQEKLSALWLIACYILLGLGDLILQTSGLSATTKLAPRAFASQSMAVWLAAIALSQGIQAQLVKAFNYDSIGFYFGIQGLCIIVYGVLLIAASRWIKARMTIIE